MFLNNFCIGKYINDVPNYTGKTDIYIEGTINTKGYNKIRHFSLGLGQVDLAVSVYPGMALRVVEEVVA